MGKKKSIGLVSGNVSAFTAPAEKDTTIIDKWESEGIKLNYVRFKPSCPVPPANKMEPVFEFYTIGPTNKYVVESITFTIHGVIFRAYGETNIVPLSSVSFCRT